MKNLLYLFLIGILFSCGGAGEDELNPEEPDVNGEPKEYIVSLGMTGEIEVSESPLLGRASSDDLYGIQVYSKTKTTDYSVYAYGLFNDKSKIKIKLLDGYQYHFVVSMVVDGVNKVSHLNDSYKLPFLGGKLCNEFIYSNEEFITGISSGTSSLPPSGIEYGLPNLDRYYGEVTDYKPIENGEISVDMKRVVFGAKFIAEGLTNGKLKIKLLGSPELYIEHGVNTEVEEIFTLGNHQSIQWTSDTYTEVCTLSVSWEKADGAIVPLVNQDITFKRKTLTTITIKVKDSSVNNGVEINQEGGDLIAGDNITLESGTGVDSPVEPNV